MLVWSCILASYETLWKTEAENKDMALLAWVADFCGEEDGAGYCLALNMFSREMTAMSHCPIQPATPPYSVTRLPSQSYRN